MALSPQELSRLFPGPISPSSCQRSLQESIELQGLSLGVPKFPIYPQVDTSQFADKNITVLLQHWLLSSLRGMPGVTPNTSDIHARSFAIRNSVISPVAEQFKQDFILQDLHEKYKKLFADYESTLKSKLFPQSALNDLNYTKPKLPTSHFSPPFPLPYFNNSYFFPPPPLLEISQKTPFSRVSNQFFPISPQTLSPQTGTTPENAFHKQTHHVKEEDTPQEISQTADSLKDKKTHKCMYCGKLYSRKYGLKIHIRTHTGYKPLKCKVCGRPFGDPSNLNKHVRLHAEGDTPYRCDFCGKVLVRRRDLERHIKSRHPNAANKIEMFSNSWKITSQ